VTDFLGGGLVFAIAAVLWIAYLVPSWLRRKNFMATEQNAARLQQTIRVLVEAEDAPAVIRADVTGRGVYEQHKALREAEAAARQAMQAQIVADALAARDPREVAALAKHRRRTQRVIAFIILMLSVLTTAAGITFVGYTGSPALMYIGLGSVVVSLVGLRILAMPLRLAAVVPVSARKPAAFVDYAPAATPSSREWTPRPLPRPLHLEPGSLARAPVDSASMAARLRQAAQEEALRERLERASEINRGRQVAASDAVKVPTVPAAAVPRNVLDEIAQLDAQSTGSLNFDELYRRRAVGE
jgi:hypothetical protein